MRILLCLCILLFCCGCKEQPKEEKQIIKVIYIPDTETEMEKLDRQVRENIRHRELIRAIENRERY
jgi:hypothetical protein